MTCLVTKPAMRHALSPPARWRRWRRGARSHRRSKRRVCSIDIRNLQPAAQRHDAAPCAVAGCMRCAAARARGAMCALAGCGARSRADSAKKLLRCGTCLAACYCSAAHQREDWRRHKHECSAPSRDDDDAAGASRH
jgi:hypothetical protein